MPLVTSAFTGSVDVTIFIPTFNGEKYLPELLSAVTTQEFDGNFEILVIDSGSTDRTLTILESYPNISVLKIPQLEFGHGRTRNKAAEIARGEYIAYLSHDAIPASEDWLDKLISPLTQIGYDAGGIFGRHVARSHADPITKYGVQDVFKACGPLDEITLVGPVDALASLDASQLFYSDVNSATRTSFLRSVIPYQDVSYSEDLAFAQDILTAGYIKIYSPYAAVVHSNDVSFTEFGKRVFDEHFGMRRVGAENKHINLSGVFLRILRDSVRTGARVIFDKDYTSSAKLRWLLVLPAFVGSKWLNIYRAQNIDPQNTEKISQYSLEFFRA